MISSRSQYMDEAIARRPRDRNLYASDGLCHNAETGTYGHECGKPATWIGTKPGGWASGFCDHCKDHGAERHGFATWERKPAKHSTYAIFRDDKFQGFCDGASAIDACDMWVTTPRSDGTDLRKMQGPWSGVEETEARQRRMIL